jgi:hypothetical protein
MQDGPGFGGCREALSAGVLRGKKQLCGAVLRIRDRIP